MPAPKDLTRRERQLLDIIYRDGELAAVDLERALPDAPSNATIRSLLSGLEKKGLLTHRKQGRSFLYRSAQPMRQVKKSAVKHLVKTLFQGSSSGAIAAILKSSEIDKGELDQLARLIEQARQEGR